MPPVIIKTSATTTSALALSARLRKFILPPESFGFVLLSEFACGLSPAAAHARALDNESISYGDEAVALIPHMFGGAFMIGGNTLTQLRSSFPTRRRIPITRQRP
jgi:hypothetical protein